MDATTHGTAEVVVGFDGSEHAEVALRYAIDEGARRGLPVRVVVAHDPPDAWMRTYGYPLLADDGGIRRAVEETAREHVETIRGQLDPEHRAVPVEVAAITGPTAFVLTEAARGADLLVLGHRGRGGLRSTLLGSTGLSVVLHAPCPVTVVPPAREAGHRAEPDAAVMAGPLPVGPIA